MTKPIFYFDFASPNAYLAHRIIPSVEVKTGAKFEYVPVLLGGIFKITGNKPPFITFADVPSKINYEKLEIARFATRHGLSKFQMNPHFPIDTLMLVRAAVAAQAEGVFPAYVEAVFSALWEQGLNMNAPEVAQKALSDAGLPFQRLVASAQQQEIKDQLMANTKAAVEHGAFGVPTFIVNSEIYFGKDRLRDVEEALLFKRT